ncbi:hypothetical protein VHEMI04143 [[Torrubiella] hemipterigena]|uniref:Uncharacterized protein n=1 Tax=[Torrubiella] hemipterigena TaxID=1531966 RepID=A0A0A1TDG2_9HYPO|nr:hypothetical protein VHEMI04143 [[Torrubiella] hemipterigena]
MPDENGDSASISVTEKRTKVDISGLKEDAGACVIEGIIAEDRLAEASSIEASDATLDTSNASLISDTTADASVASDTETPDTQISDSSAESTENAEANDEVYAERFPKEYKQYMRWSFDKVLENGIFDTNGVWTRGKQNSIYAWPIRQAFSYSLKYRCRYGCIVSSHEAFIFRIKPIRQEKEIEELLKDFIEEQSLSEEKEREMMEDLLMAEIADNGEMQYVCIPWSNDYTNIKHAENEPNTTQDSKNQGVEKVTDIADWTINLAFWYLHMMIGSNYKVKWTYENLADEKLQPLSLAASNLLSSTNQALELKRRRQQGHQLYQPREDQSSVSTSGIDQNQSISVRTLQEQDEALQESIATSTLSPAESIDLRSEASSMTERHDDSSDNEGARRKRRRGNDVRSSPRMCRVSDDDPVLSFYKASFE